MRKTFNMQNAIKKAETSLINSSSKNRISTLNHYFKVEKKSSKNLGEHSI